METFRLVGMMGVICCWLAVAVQLAAMLSWGNAFAGVDFVRCVKDSYLVSLFLLILDWVMAVGDSLLNSGMVSSNFLALSGSCFMAFGIGIISELFMGRRRNARRREVCARLNRLSAKYGFLFLVLSYLLQ